MMEILKLCAQEVCVMKWMNQRKNWKPTTHDVGADNLFNQCAVSGASLCVVHLIYAVIAFG